MEAEALAKTLEVLKAISRPRGVPRGILPVLLGHPRGREGILARARQRRTETTPGEVQEMAEMLGERESLLVPNWRSMWPPSITCKRSSPGA